MNPNPFRALAVVSFALITSHATAAEPVVEYCGIQVIARSYGKDQGAIRPFQAFDDGVKVAFLVSSATGGLIAIEEKEGTIDTFTDDKGSPLMKKDDFKNGFGSFPSVSEDGKGAVFTLEGTVAPAKGATSVIAKGSVAVKTASKKETLKGGALTKDAVVTCGKQKLNVKEVKASGAETTVELESDESFDAIMEIRWLDAAGKPLEADSRGSSSFGFNGKRTYNREWSVKGKPATIEFVAWTDMKTVNLPFSATVPIGPVK